MIVWSTAPLLLTTLLAVVAFGREVVVARPGAVELFLGLPFIGLVLEYDPAAIRNLRIEHPAKKSGKAWRGAHLAFDYGANSAAFGSNLSQLDLEPLRQQLQRATGTTLRSGQARPAELQGDWGAGSTWDGGCRSRWGSPTAVSFSCTW